MQVLLPPALNCHPRGPPWIGLSSGRQFCGEALIFSLRYPNLTLFFAYFRECYVSFFIFVGGIASDMSHFWSGIWFQIWGEFLLMYWIWMAYGSGSPKLRGLRFFVRFWHLSLLQAMPTWLRVESQYLKNTAVFSWETSFVSQNLTDSRTHFAILIFVSSFKYLSFLPRSSNLVLLKLSLFWWIFKFLV